MLTLAPETPQANRTLDTVQQTKLGDSGSDAEREARLTELVEKVGNIMKPSTPSIGLVFGLGLRLGLPPPLPLSLPLPPPLPLPLPPPLPWPHSDNTRLWVRVRFRVRVRASV